MPDIQDVLALGVVALVAGGFLWRRWQRRGRPGPAAKSDACSDCTSAAPPKKEATVHFYRRRE